jgi:hypothetical protein
MKHRDLFAFCHWVVRKQLEESTSHHWRLENSPGSSRRQKKATQRIALW